MNYYKIVNEKIVLKNDFYFALKQMGFKSIRDFFDSSWEEIEKRGEKQDIGCRIPYANENDLNLIKREGTLPDIRGNNYCNDKGKKVENSFAIRFSEQGRFPANLMVGRGFDLDLNELIKLQKELKNGNIR